MKRASWGAWVGLLLLGVGCGGGKAVRLDPSAASQVLFPSIFCYPPGGLVGIGFNPPGYYYADESFARATERACRLLAWSIHVRVQGERLVEQLATGQMAFRGENFKLLELPEVLPETCHLETLEVKQHAWVIATQEGSTARVGGWTAFSAERPAWISQLPEQSGWLYSVGLAQISYRDEPGSWEVATYNALIELALSAGSRIAQIDKKADDWLEGASSVAVDTELSGFRVGGRWRDGEHVYVLGKAPTAQVVSHLGKSKGP